MLAILSDAFMVAVYASFFFLSNQLSTAQLNGKVEHLLSQVVCARRRDHTNTLDVQYKYTDHHRVYRFQLNYSFLTMVSIVFTSVTV